MIYLDIADVEDISGQESRHFESTIPPRIEKPRVGLLSQTVVQTPTTLLVLPARLRNKCYNDVVLVGERHIQIKEVMPGFRLEDVVFKSDFDATIMAARSINVSSTSGLSKEGLPSHMMVLTLSSGELVFLYHSGDDFIRFCRLLPSYVRYLDSFGRYVTVDPR